jgi:23S rRNA (cytosine1962-C5)-methyltransferase
VKFEVDLTRGHKTGFFCDQRDNRLALTGFTPGKSVLDLCCYSGGFSCYAATRGGAADVTAVDIDETALETAERNRRSLRRKRWLAERGRGFSGPIRPC